MVRILERLIRLVGTRSYSTHSLTLQGSVPIRLEIRDLQKNTDQWNLYLLGLTAFKNVDETSDLSYYGIAGIHGRPYRPWGGVKGANAGGWQGYCTHTS
jgi:tyrosinase